MNDLKRKACAPDAEGVLQKKEKQSAKNVKNANENTTVKLEKPRDIANISTGIIENGKKHHIGANTCANTAKPHNIANTSTDVAKHQNIANTSANTKTESMGFTAVICHNSTNSNSVMGAYIID